ncbi:MAG: zf-HC2 domain-containing protein [Acidobacteriota bacterium]|nr:zf-HC2 domain-containing protein [Acidobacteriota bacterium]
MTLMTCSSVRRHLHAFYDRELPVRELISIEGHVETCPPCTRELGAISSIGDGLRLAVAPGPADDWTGLQPGVISRMRAEHTQSLAARAQRFIDDVHLVWIGLASATATLVLAGSILSILASAHWRPDSMAAEFAFHGAKAGSNLNPASLDGRGLDLGPTPVMVPTVPQGGVVYATLLGATVSEEDVMIPLSARVTTEGYVENIEMLNSEASPTQIHDIVDALSRGRISPAHYGDSPVAVNLVWLLASTTVRGKT